jgi:hypothetical protein
MAILVRISGALNGRLPLPQGMCGGGTVWPDAGRLIDSGAELQDIVRAHGRCVRRCAMR